MKTRDIIRIIKHLPKDRITEISIKYEEYNIKYGCWKPANLILKENKNEKI